jgi:hypothetical protein
MPGQQYPTFAQLAAAINAEIDANGMNEITGPILNSLLNGLLTFVEESPLNWNKTTLWNTGGAVVAPGPNPPNSIGPVIVFTTITPTSFGFGPNIYNEYVIANLTSNPIPLAAGSSYINSLGQTLTQIGANQVTDLFMTPSGTWVQGNNPVVPGSLPSLVGAAGQFLTNNGTTAFWSNTFIKLPISAFSSPTQYANAGLLGQFYDLQSADVGRFLLGPDDPGSEWSYLPAGGFQVLIPSFNLQTLSYPIYLWLKSNPV